MADACNALNPDDQPPIIRRCQREPGHEPPHRDQTDRAPAKFRTAEWVDEPPRDDSAQAVAGEDVVQLVSAPPQRGLVAAVAGLVRRRLDGGVRGV